MNEQQSTLLGNRKNLGSSKRSSTASGDRSQARTALKWVRFVRLMMYVWALRASLAMIMLTIFALDSEPLEPTLLALLALGFGVAVLGIRFADRYPLPAPLILTLISSLGLINWILDPQLEGEGLATPLGSLFWMSMYGFCCFQALRLRRLTKADPDSYIARLMRNEGAENETGHQARELESHYANKAKEKPRLIFWSVMFCSLLLVILISGL